MGLPKLFTTRLCRLSPSLPTCYSLYPHSQPPPTHLILVPELSPISSSHLLWSFSNLLLHAHGLSNPERVMQEGRSKQSIFLLRGWGDPTTLLSVTSLLSDADAVSPCLLVSLASSHKRRLKELNTYDLVTRSLMKAIIMLSNTWSI